MGVSDRMVAKYRDELTPKDSESDSRTGADGRTIDTSNIGKQSGDEDEIVEVDEDEEAPEGYEYVDVEEEEDQSRWAWLEQEATGIAENVGGKKISEWIDALAQEVQRDASVAFCRLENLAIKL